MSTRRPPLSAAGLALFTVGLAFSAPGCGPREATFRTAFAEGVERVWIGPDFYANRLQDWRLRDGRVEAVEGRAAKPMRTLSLLTATLGEAASAASLEVRLGSLSAGPDSEDTWAGFLLGAGGSHVDYRVTALVHHWPSTDGGLFVGVDGTGRIVVRDNSVNQGYRGPAADIPTGAWPLLEPVGSGGQGGWAGAYRLAVAVEPAAGGYRLRVEAREEATDSLLAWGEYEAFEPGQLAGGVALVSHRSRNGRGPAYWFDDLSLRGPKVQRHPERAFGPVMGAFYTLSAGTLKLTAQLGPVGSGDPPTARLETRAGGRWVERGTAPVVEGSSTATFKVEGWDGREDVPFRVVYEVAVDGRRVEPYRYEGVVRKVPWAAEEFVLAAFTGHNITGGDGQWNGSHFWYPHNELVRAVAYHDPDLLFFSGDQIYEAGLAGVVREPLDEAILDYLYHWYRFVWAFRDLARERPTVMIPDDHDVYHGNIWGNAGESFEGDFSVQDRGGYRMDPEWVNVVHRTQTSNLPDPPDPAPLANGITVYTTRVEYAGLSFAVLADRMFKSPPAPLLPEGGVVNGWFQNPAFDPVTQADVPGARLLGERQERFLAEWVEDWSEGAWMKVVLSQTPFADVATIPAWASSGSVLPTLPLPAEGEYVEGDKKAADADSNGWPQSARNRALRILRRGFALHVAGDQHLGSFLHYGVEEFNDAGYGFVVPSIANFWPRRWFPPEPGGNREPGAPRYTGEFLDGFGNRMTVLAVANPMRSGVEPAALYDRTPGYGIVRFRRSTRQITVENWPRWVDPSDPEARPYPGWPRTVSQMENYGRPPAGYLPTLEVQDVDEPVVQVVDEEEGRVVYTLRIPGREFRPPVFRVPGSYTVRVGEPDAGAWMELRGIRPGSDTTLVVRVGGGTSRVPKGDSREGRS